MAKIVSDKGSKSQAKTPGLLKGAISRPAPSVRQSTTPRGTVSVKPVGRTRTFLREVRVEMTKVTWPPRKELLQATGVVIIAVVIAGAYIGLFDYIWTVIVRAAGLG
jgi:preprotein translocase subunit SecE